MVKFGLDARESENEELLDAVPASAAACIRVLRAGRSRGRLPVGHGSIRKRVGAGDDPHLVECLPRRMGCYGGISCGEIIAGKPMKQMVTLSGLIAQTLEKCRGSWKTTATRSDDGQKRLLNSGSRKKRAVRRSPSPPCGLPDGKAPGDAFPVRSKRGFIKNSLPA
jgi:hypothetical protein